MYRDKGTDELIKTDLFCFTPILSTQVYKLLLDLDCNKSAGPDKIDSVFLKLSAAIIAEPIASIFNLSLSTNIIPLTWKSAMVMPLPKGGDSSDLNNYRPISRLSVLFIKVFEPLVN